MASSVVAMSSVRRLNRRMDEIHGTAAMVALKAVF
jgi:hypothetical protein